MGLADTARLVASLELEDKFSGTASNASRALGQIDTATQRAGRQMGIFGHATATALGIGLQRAVASGIGAVVGSIRSGVDQLNELESVTTATNTVIGSTMGVAGQTASEIRALAEEYESLNAAMGDDVIQAGSNMLLTFTNIRDKAFEPALAAALDMNEAMGGGPEGLQNTIIQVGKALNDPILGVGALRRVGVQLTAQQEDQIKTLVQANDLYGAQSVILDELATQFGGRFAAAGRTAEGRQAALVDRTEDLQKALAGPLMPAIDRARENLITLFESPAAIAASTRLGETVAGLFTEENLGRGVGVLEEGMSRIAAFDFDQVGDGVQKVFGFLGEVPWDTIGAGLEITGRATKGVVDAFLSLPKEVQGVVIAGLAVNKLSGGIVGDLAVGGIRGLISGLRTVTAANVTVVGGNVIGGGGAVPVPGRTGGGGLFSGGRGLALGLGAAGVAALLADEFEDEIEGFAGDLRQAIVGDFPGLPSGPSDWDWPFGSKNTPAWLTAVGGGPDRPAGPINPNADLWNPRFPNLPPSRVLADAGSSGFGFQALTELIDKIKALTLPDTAMGLPDTAMAPVKAAVLSQTAELVRSRTEISGKLMASISKQDQVVAAIRGQSGLLGQIRDSKQPINLHNKIAIAVQVGVSEIQYRTQSLTSTIGGPGSGNTPI